MLVFKDPTLKFSFEGFTVIPGTGKEVQDKLQLAFREHPRLFTKKVLPGEPSRPVDCIIFVEDPFCVDPSTNKPVSYFAIHRLYDIEVARHYTCHYELDTAKLVGKKFLVSNIDELISDIGYEMGVEYQSGKRDPLDDAISLDAAMDMLYDEEDFN